MTDKLDPGWVNDRLPTEKDLGEHILVLCIDDEGILERHFSLVKEGEAWCPKPLKKYPIEVGKKWSDVIATPQECLDREEGESVKTDRKIAVSKFGNYVFTNMDEEIEFQNDKMGYCYPVREWIKFQQEAVSSKDLEQALAKSEERVKEMEKEYNEVAMEYRKEVTLNVASLKFVKELLGIVEIKRNDITEKL